MREYNEREQVNMRSGQRVGVLLVAISGLASGAISYEFGGEQWGPAVKRIEAAAALPDPEARLRMLRETIESGLTSQEPGVGREVSKFLEEKQRWIDLRPFVSILDSYSAWLADEGEFFRASRQDRVEVCRRAIVEGKITLRRGRPIPRGVAMGIAAEEGLEELKPLIEEYYDQLPPVIRTYSPREELLESMELRAGASDLEGAIERACERLAAMSDAELKQKMDTDVHLQQIADTLAQEACAVDPIGLRSSPGCAVLKGVVDRQEHLFQMEVEKGTVKPKWVVGNRAGREADWLTRLDDRVPWSPPTPACTGTPPR